MTTPPDQVSSRIKPPSALLGFATIAFCAGVFFRFWGLGHAPLAVDEYYFGTSILNILNSGLPEFPCGGYYTRGILLQYISLAPVYFGANLELAVRLSPAICSIIAIGAVWKLGQRIGGTGVACVAVALVSLSIWEIEFARFGRMYAPFQALFLWYAYFQLRHLVDNDRIAQVYCFLLSAISIFVYAGAAILLALNFLPLLWPDRRCGARHLASALGLLLIGLLYYRTDFRFMGIPEAQLPPLPVMDDTALSGGLSLPVPIDIPYFPGNGFVAIALGISLLGLLLWSNYRNLRLTHPSAMLWLIALSAICFGAISLGAALLLIGVLLRAPIPVRDAGELQKRIQRYYLPGLVLLAILVLVNAIVAGPDMYAAAKDALNYLFNFPDVYYKVVSPWLGAIPLTSIALSLILIPLLWTSLRQRYEEVTQSALAIRYLFAVLIALVLLVGLLKQPYHISRYTFFLYPIVLLLAAVSIVGIARRIESLHSLPSSIVVFVAFAMLLFTEDFGFAHLASINEPVSRYRLDYNDDLAEHYYMRWDFRAVAEYTNEHAGPDDSIVVFHQALPHYLERTDGIFIREGGTIHSITWGCGGSRELWSNAPLLDTDDEVHKVIDSSRGNTWLIMRAPQFRWLDPLESFLVDSLELTPYFESVDGNLAVYRVPAASGEEDELQE